jgi:hypothetical protein
MVTASMTIRPFYYWGQVYQHVGSDNQVLATYKDRNHTFRFDGTPYNGDDWKNMAGRPCVIAGNYGQGRVILSGPHPEVGEEQIFMDWIYYLAGGCLQASTVTATTSVEPSYPDRTLLIDFLKEVETFKDIATPYASQIKPYWKSRWEGHITIGLPVLLIVSDIWDRLTNLKKAATYYLNLPEEHPIPIGPLDVKRLKIARLAFDGLILDLEKNLKMLQEKDRIPAAVKKRLSTERSFYPEDYFDLVEHLKSVHLPLLEIEYRYQRHKIKTSF